MAIRTTIERGTQYGVLPTNGKMLTVSEAARYISVHANSVRRWADMGLLPAHRFGSRGDRRFRADDLSNFLDSWKGR